MESLFYKFRENIIGSYRGRNWMYHFLAILVTYILVISGFDWKYFRFFAGSRLSFILFSAALVGILVPVLVPIFLLVVGKIQKSTKLLNTGFALGQAAMIGYFISIFYKFWTGRVAPPLNHLHNAVLDTIPLHNLDSPILDTSRVFKFGIFHGGIFWGWPSSHTTIAFAMVFTLLTLYSENNTSHKVIRVLALIYAFYIGIGASMTIHWFSDFVAGAIIGTAVGMVVGKTFKTRKLFI